jgi:hypothetical protein
LENLIVRSKIVTVVIPPLDLYMFARSLDSAIVWLLEDDGFVYVRWPVEDEDEICCAVQAVVHEELQINPRKIRLVVYICDQGPVFWCCGCRVAIWALGEVKSGFGLGYRNGIALCLGVVWCHW